MNEQTNRMDAFSRLRYLVGNFRKRFFPKQRRPVVWVDGLPRGLETALVDALCQEHFGERLSSVRHHHLSGWKASGAYRIQVRAGRGSRIQLIYKDAYYSAEEIPALVGLPARPGRPEYILYHQEAGPLASYLPRAYLAEEVSAGTHYRYIFEDLSLEYRRAYTHDDILLASRQMPALHQALEAWTQQAQTAGMQQYGREFSLALQQYAFAGLSQYQLQVEEDTLRTVLQNWDDIAALHVLPEFFNRQPERPIHGDPNFTNIHIHKQDRRKIKLVDWEWAGFGLPHSDLASLLKGTPDYVEQDGLRQFSSQGSSVLNLDLSPQENGRLYQWAKLERGLLDAAFLAAQALHSHHRAKFNLSRAISQALTRALHAYRQLA